MAKRRVGRSRRRKLGHHTAAYYNAGTFDALGNRRLNRKRRPPLPIGSQRPKRARVAPRRTGPAIVRFKRRGTFGPLTASKKRAGRRKPMTVRKLTKLSCNHGILRFQGVNRLNGVVQTEVQPDGSVNMACPGFFTLGNASIADNQILPLHMYDLTVMNNLTETGTGVLRTLSLRDNGVVQWSSVNGQNPLGVQNTPGYTWEYVNNPISTNSVSTEVLTYRTQAKFIRHEWFDIRFLLYGARKQPTFFDIMLVRFDHDHLLPDSVVAVGSEEQTAQVALYQGLTKNLAYNPIMPGFSGAFKGMRVIRRWRKYIQASETDSADRNPRSHQLKIFYRDDIVRNYDWAPRYHDTAAAHDGPNYVQQLRRQDMRDHPYNRSRMFLMVRAMNTTNQNSTGGNISDLFADADNTPSYDIIIRKKVMWDGQTYNG